MTQGSGSGAVFRAWLDRIQGDMSALGEVFAHHCDMVFRTALRLTGSCADAEDAEAAAESRKCSRAAALRDSLEKARR